MSAFYGQVEGDLSKTLATRRSNHYAKSSVQSYNGSVISKLNYSDDGCLMVTISLSKGSSFCGQSDLPQFYGTFEDLKECFRDWNRENVQELE